MLSTVERALERCFSYSYKYNRPSTVYPCQCFRRLSLSSTNSGKTPIARVGVRLKKLAPVKIQQRHENYEKQKQKEELKQFSSQYRQDLREYGDVMEEPNLARFSENLDQHLKETEAGRDIMKRQKMFRKHFRHLDPPELNLLTWAEKENIRYLTETDPETWTPEAIAEAYPISVRGVQKLMKAQSKMRTAIDVRRHDMQVEANMRDIDSGKIEITEELERKLEIRDMIPFKVGQLGANTEHLIIHNELKPTGEFAQLVALPKDTAKIGNKKKESVKYLSDGDIYSPEHLPSDEVDETRKPELTRDELGQILHLGKRITFREFEGLMTKQKASSLSADMEYMLQLNSRSRTNAEDDAIGISEPEVLEIRSKHERTSFPSQIIKYKAPEETGKMPIKMEGQEAYVYHPDTGYQKPFQPSNAIREKITIPEDAKKPDAIYKVGDCFYDEDGEFLYKVV